MLALAAQLELVMMLSQICSDTHARSNGDTFVATSASAAPGVPGRSIARLLTSAVQASDSAIWQSRPTEAQLATLRLLEGQAARGV